MGWLRCTYRRCCEWVRSLFDPPSLTLHIGTRGIPEPEIFSTCAGARVSTVMRIRQETPAGIARLAEILAECMDDAPVPSGGRLARHAARRS